MSILVVVQHAVLVLARVPVLHVHMMLVGCSVMEVMFPHFDLSAAPLCIILTPNSMSNPAAAVHVWPCAHGNCMG